MRIETEKPDILLTEIGREETRRPMDARRLAQRHARAAHDATEQHCTALEDLILSSRAEDAPGALVQVLIAGCRLDTIAQEGEQGRLEAALQSAVRALAAALGIELIKVGGRCYASTWCDHWPVVDTAGIDLGETDHPDHAIDGSGAA